MHATRDDTANAATREQRAAPYGKDRRIERRLREQVAPKTTGSRLDCESHTRTNGPRGRHSIPATSSGSRFFALCGERDAGYRTCRRPRGPSNKTFSLRRRKASPGQLAPLAFIDEAEVEV